MPLQQTKALPPIVVHIGAVIGPIQLKDYFSNSTESLYFRAELADGQSLPQGVICTQDGLINGIAAEDTDGFYQVKVFAENDVGDKVESEFELDIRGRLVLVGDDLFKKLKSQVWEALGKNLPLPEFEDLLNRPITAVELYYLLQRFATLTIWDVYNLDSPSIKKELKIEGLNEHYIIYDRGSCIVGAPKDLFSHDRNLEHALQTARVMAREAYKRGWVIEFAGFDKMVRAAWVELRLLGDKQGKYLDIVHYTPTPDDLKVYEAQAKARPAQPTP